MITLVSIWTDLGTTLHPSSSYRRSHIISSQRPISAVTQTSVLSRPELNLGEKYLPLDQRFSLQMEESHGMSQSIIPNFYHKLFANLHIKTPRLRTIMIRPFDFSHPVPCVPSLFLPPEQ